MRPSCTGFEVPCSGVAACQVTWVKRRAVICCVKRWCVLTAEVSCDDLWFDKVAVKG